ncbi:MAG: hypothetical protein ACO3RM_07195 [Paracoccaceae bacterium]|jgi:hypothetical protein
MKPVTESKLFVEPRNYRARRMVDGLRVLPLAGIFLIAMPLFWGGAEDSIKSSAVMLFLFGVWIFLILLNFFMTRRIGKERDWLDPINSETSVD